MAQQVGATPSRAVQADLQALGYDPGIVDGRWRRQSLLALKHFQKAEGLPETGKAGPQTIARLRQRRSQPEQQASPTVETAKPAFQVLVPVAPAPASLAGPSPASPPPPAEVTAQVKSVPPVDARPTAPDLDATRTAPERSDRAVSVADAAIGKVTTSDGPTTVGVPATPPSPGLPWVAALAPGLLACWGVLRQRRRRRPATPPPQVPAGSTGGASPRSDLAAMADGSEVVGTGLPPGSTGSIGDVQPTTPPPDEELPAESVATGTAAAASPPDDTATVPDRTARRDVPTARSEETSGAEPPVAVALPKERPGPSRQRNATTSPHRAAGDRAWLPAGAQATVAGIRLPGLVYVGRTLPAAEGHRRNDNCLVDPGLGISKGNADVAGQHMDYWPAYESMRPSSRRAYLEWLSGDRSDPATYIGYVFVYLYGLERRAVLERSVEDWCAIRGEVERLLKVYSHNGSFRRYAANLRSALGILSLAPGQDPTPTFAPCGGELPSSIRLAVGSRVLAGRPVEPDWMLAWAMSHPETQVRASARRAIEHLRAEFADEFALKHPAGGLSLPSRKGGTSPILYKAASGTFTADLAPDGCEAMPDLAQFPEALAAGRALLDLCSDRLDAYGRHLGRDAGQAGPGTLRTVALLPVRRRVAAMGPQAEGDLAWLAGRAATGTPIPFAEASRRVLGRSEDKATPARLRDLADTLCRLGLGLIPDPRFPVRVPATPDVMLFALEGPREAMDGPSDAYKAAFLALSLGMLMAMADGEVTDDERVVLREAASTSPGLVPDERIRLKADASWLEAYPTGFSALRARLAELPEGRKRTIGDILVRVASSDGKHHGAKVALLEKAFRHLGLDQGRLYSALHGANLGPGTAVSAAEATDGPVLVVPGPGHETTYPIPGVSAPTSPRTRKRLPDPDDVPAPSVPATQVDAGRLAAIRSETEAVSAVLAGVFDLDADGTSPQAAAILEGRPAGGEDAIDGLDPCHSRLLRELLGRPVWSRAEFGRLAREHGLMPGAAMEELNAWSFERFDEAIVEDDDPVHLNLDLIPEPLSEAA